MRRSTHLPSLVSLAQIFLTPKDPTSKKFFDPGACSLHPGTATTKAHRLGWDTCDLHVCNRWCLSFNLQGPGQIFASLYAAARATCHVRRAHLKSAKARVRRVGLSTLKIWCKSPEPFQRQRPGTSTDRQKEGGTDRQKMPTYPRYESSEYKGRSNANAYEFSFVFLRFWNTHIRS